MTELTIEQLVECLGARKDATDEAAAHFAILEHLTLILSQEKQRIEDEEVSSDSHPKSLEYKQLVAAALDRLRGMVYEGLSIHAAITDAGIKIKLRQYGEFNDLSILIQPDIDTAIAEFSHMSMMGHIHICPVTNISETKSIIAKMKIGLAMRPGVPGTHYEIVNPTSRFPGQRREQRLAFCVKQNRHMQQNSILHPPTNLTSKHLKSTDPGRLRCFGTVAGHPRSRMFAVQTHKVPSTSVEYQADDLVMEYVGTVLLTAPSGVDHVARAQQVSTTLANALDTDELPDIQEATPASTTPLSDREQGVIGPTAAAPSPLASTINVEPTKAHIFSYKSSKAWSQAFPASSSAQHHHYDRILDDIAAFIQFVDKKEPIAQVDYINRVENASLVVDYNGSTATVANFATYWSEVKAMALLMLKKLRFIAFIQFQRLGISFEPAPNKPLCNSYVLEKAIDDSDTTYTTASITDGIAASIAKVLQRYFSVDATVERLDNREYHFQLFVSLAMEYKPVKLNTNSNEYIEYRVESAIHPSGDDTLSAHWDAGLVNEQGLARLSPDPAVVNLAPSGAARHKDGSKFYSKYGAWANERADGGPASFVITHNNFFQPSSSVEEDAVGFRRLLASKFAADVLATLGVQFSMYDGSKRRAVDPQTVKEMESQFINSLLVASQHPLVTQRRGMAEVAIDNLVSSFTTSLKSMTSPRVPRSELTMQFRVPAEHYSADANNNNLVALIPGTFILSSIKEMISRLVQLDVRRFFGFSETEAYIKFCTDFAIQSSMVLKRNVRDEVQSLYALLEQSISHLTAYSGCLSVIIDGFDPTKLNVRAFQKHWQAVWSSMQVAGVPRLPPLLLAGPAGLAALGLEYAHAPVASRRWKCDVGVASTGLSLLGRNFLKLSDVSQMKATKKEELVFLMQLVRLTPPCMLPVLLNTLLGLSMLYEMAVVGGYKIVVQLSRADNQTHRSHITGVAVESIELDLPGQEQFQFDLPTGHLSDLMLPQNLKGLYHLMSTYPAGVHHNFESLSGTRAVSLEQYVASLLDDIDDRIKTDYAQDNHPGFNVFKAFYKGYEQMYGACGGGNASLLARQTLFHSQLVFYSQFPALRVGADEEMVYFAASKHDRNKWRQGRATGARPARLSYVAVACITPEDAQNYYQHSAERLAHLQTQYWHPYCLRAAYGIEDVNSFTFPSTDASNDLLDSLVCVEAINAFCAHVVVSLKHRFRKGGNFTVNDSAYDSRFARVVEAAAADDSEIEDSDGSNTRSESEFDFDEYSTSEDEEFSESEYATSSESDESMPGDSDDD